MATITFTCYACNQVLKVSGDKAGKKARCVKCGTILTIPAGGGEEDAGDVVSPIEEEPTPARRRPRDDDEDDRPRRKPRNDFDDLDEPASRRRGRDDDDDDRPRRRGRDEEDDYDDRPRRRSRDEDDDYDRPRRGGGGGAWGSWSKVKLGLLLQFIGAMVVAAFGAVMALAFVFRVIGGAADSAGLVKTAGIIGFIGMIIYVAVAIPLVIGWVFCLFTPNKRGGLALAITLLSIAGTALVLKIIFVMIPTIKTLSAAEFGPFGGMAGLGVSLPVVATPTLTSDTFAVNIIFGVLLLLVFDAEWIMAPLYVRSVGLAVKSRYVPGAAMMPMVVGIVAAGLRLTLYLVFLIWFRSILTAAFGGGGGLGSFKAMYYVTGAIGIITYGAVTAFALMQMRLFAEARRAV